MLLIDWLRLAHFFPYIAVTFIHLPSRFKVGLQWFPRTLVIMCEKNKTLYNHLIFSIFLSHHMPYTHAQYHYWFVHVWNHGPHGSSVYRVNHECPTWGRRASLLHQRRLWTVWQHCPGPGGGKCPPHSSHILWWTPHTSAPGLAPFEAQTVAHTSLCPWDFFQTLQRGREVTRGSSKSEITFTHFSHGLLVIVRWCFKRLICWSEDIFVHLLRQLEKQRVRWEHWYPSHVSKYEATASSWWAYSSLVNRVETGKSIWEVEEVKKKKVQIMHISE